MDNVKFGENGNITITHEVEYIRLTHKFIIPDDLTEDLFEYGDKLNTLFNGKDQSLTPELKDIHMKFQDSLKRIKEELIPERLYSVFHMYKYIMKFEKPNELKIVIELPSNVYTQWEKVLNNNLNEEE